jgi:hypothetical protein
MFGARRSDYFFSHMIACFRVWHSGRSVRRICRRVIIRRELFQTNVRRGEQETLHAGECVHPSSLRESIDRHSVQEHTQVQGNNELQELHTLAIEKVKDLGPPMLEWKP